MRETASVIARVAGLVVAISSAGCHMVFGDFEVVEQGTGGGGATCQTGDFRCNGAMLQSCSQGIWTDFQACPQPEYCLAAEGRCQICKAGGHRCDGQILQECNAAEDGWTTVLECETDLVCDEDEQECVTCKKGSARCFDDLTGLETCNANQSGWTTERCGAEGCVNETGDCDYCAGCSPEGKWRCSPCGKVLQCKGGRWEEQNDCQRVGLCIVDSSGAAYCN